MKKVLIAAAITLFGFAVQAQENRTHNISFSLDLSDVICMSLYIPNPLEGNFTGYADYVGNHKSLGQATFTVKSNRLFNVTTSLVSLSWTGANGHNYNATYDVNKNMLPGVISWSCINPAGWPAPVNGYTYSGPAAGFGAASYNDYTGFATPISVIGNAPYGTGRAFTMEWFATPGWNYTGGLYMGLVSVTATQE